MADYLIPFGVDAERFFAELDEMAGGVDDLMGKTKAAGGEMKKAFEGAAGAGDKLNKTLISQAEKTAALASNARTLGRDLGTALSGGGVGEGLKGRFNDFISTLGKIRQAASQKISVNVETQKLEYFEKLLTEGAADLRVLAEVSAFAKQQLEALDPGSAEFAELSQQIQVADAFLEGLAETTQDVETKNVSLRTRLRELKAEMAELEIAGKANTEEFRRLAIEAGSVEDQIGDVSQRVRVLASDTKYIDAGIQAVTGLAGAFTAAQGAAALFGEDNEELAKTIQKVTGAMAILQGIQAVANALNKDSALNILFFSRAQNAATVSTVAQTGATVAATAATRAWTIALLKNPIFLLVAVIAAVTAALYAFAGGQSEAERQARKLNDTLQRQSDLLKLDEGDIRRRTALDVARAKAAGKSESDITTIEGKAINERIKLREDNLAELKRLYNDETNRKKRSAEDDLKLSQQISATQEEIDDLNNEAQVKKIDRDKQRADEAKDIRKKSLEDQRKYAEEQKQILDQQIKFTRELEDARISQIANAYDRERALVTKQANDKIQDLQREKALSTAAAKQRTELIKQIRAQEAAERKKIDAQEKADRVAAQLEADQLVNDLRDEGTAKELEGLRLRFQRMRREVEERYKDDALQRRRLLRVINQAEADETDKITRESQAKKLKVQEETEVLLIETAAEFVGKGKEVEEQKQIAILQVKLKFAKLALEALINQGNAENSVVVLQAKKTVQDLEKALGVAVSESEGKGIDIFKLLGLGSLSDEQKEAVAAAARSALDSLREITNFIVDQYQRQIDKRQEVIDQISESIDDLEDQLEREKELRENGFANNVELVEREIEDKKRQREEEIKQQEELQRRQQAIQRAQLVADTATQASSLITAAAQIFKALSSIPVIGIPLAITTIALMTGAFVSAKVRAFQLVNEGGRQFGGGGWIDGKPHGQGGKKYISADGTGDVVELEGGEHVTRKSSAKKYRELLDAINEDRLSGMSDAALKELLSGTGVHLPAEDIPGALDTHREFITYREQSQATAPRSDIEETVKFISRDVNYLAEKKRGEIQRWEDENYFYEQKGQTIKKTKK